MPTEVSHTRRLASIAALAQLLMCQCQSASSMSDPIKTNVMPTPAASSSMSPAASSGGVAGKPAPASPPTAVSNPPTSGSSSNTTPAASSSTAGAGGSLGAQTTPTAQAGAAGSAGSSGVSDSSNAPDTSGLPAVSDFKAAGPFTPKSATSGPSGYVLYYPQELGKDGVKHPILSWGPGAAETAADFSMLLSHLASHGFAIIAFDGTPQGQELVTGIDWMVSENMKEGSMFFQKLDDTKIAAAGHSAGSLATFVIGGDKRLVTTMHISGGTFDPHTDIMNLHAPALFVCGEDGGDGLLQGDVAAPNCKIDFDNAMVPVFYGVTKGAAHMTPTDIGDPMIRTQQFGAMVGWLRWQLAGDANAKNMFVGDGCGLCMDAAWSSAKQKNLN